MFGDSLGDNSDSIISKLHEENDALRQRNKDLQEIRETYISQITDLKKELADASQNAKNQVNEWRDKCQDLENFKDESLRVMEQFRARVVEDLEIINALKKENSEYKKFYDGANYLASRLQSENADLRFKLAGYENEQSIMTREEIKEP